MEQHTFSANAIDSTMKRIIELRAVLVHWNAHNIDIAVQDAIFKIFGARIFIQNNTNMIYFM